MLPIPVTIYPQCYLYMDDSTMMWTLALFLLCSLNGVLLTVMTFIASPSSLSPLWNLSWGPWTKVGGPPGSSPAFVYGFTTASTKWGTMYPFLCLSSNGMSFYWVSTKFSYLEFLQMLIKWMNESEVEEYNLQSREKLLESWGSVWSCYCPRPLSYASFMFPFPCHLLREFFSDIPGWIGSFRPLFCNTPVISFIKYL